MTGQELERHGASFIWESFSSSGPARIVAFKIPESVLVVIYTPQLRTLLLRRADHGGFWQSVTGSRDSAGEPLAATCAREVREETGWQAAPGEFTDWHLENEFEIFPHWRHRYAPGVTRNREHVFGLCVGEAFTPQLSPREHTDWKWLGWQEAADTCFSWTNAKAIRLLPQMGTGDSSSPFSKGSEGPGGEGPAADP